MNQNNCQECRDNDGLPEQGWPRRWWHCTKCGAHMDSYGSDLQCPGCGAWFNTFGQHLRDDWAGNPSRWDEAIDDLTGYEIQHADE